MITQIELEEEMCAFGKKRAANMMSGNEQRGSADNNPYASAIYRRFVIPLADRIREDVFPAIARPSRRGAYVALLEPMDAEVVAFIAVRTVLNALVSGRTSDMPIVSGGVMQARPIITELGRHVYHELMLTLFAGAEPDLFYTIMYDMGRRMSKNERYRVRVFQQQAKANGIDFPSWGTEGQQQVGSYLLDCLNDLGLVVVELNNVVAGKSRSVRSGYQCYLSEDAIAVIDQIKDMIIETTPYYLPCVEQPKDWVGIADGGWHTNDMRRMQPFCIKSHGGWSELAEHDLSTVFQAINTLQRVKWRINGKMLDAIRDVAQFFDMDEVVSRAEKPKPSKPVWLTEDMKKDTMSKEQLDEFKAWKRETAIWFSEMKIRGTKYGRFFTATSVAQKFRSFPAIHFVYFADFRGRLYAQTTGVSPQGSDMQKALLEFAEGKPLLTNGSKNWFKIAGANRWGVDKVSLDDRIKWVDKHHNLICSFAENPVDNRGWKDADSPLQFLAWAFEYKEWCDKGDAFESRIAVGMDGSCNGLQNFSAMLRDEVGGAATNLIPASLPNDIYGMVAVVTARLLRAAEDWEVPVDDGSEDAKKAIKRALNANRFRPLWLAHGINRTLVKRSVMTLPYGSTRFSCADFIADDYLKQGYAPEFDKNDYRDAAQYLSHFVWEAIAEVVVKAREAMSYLQGQTKGILKDHDAIRWITPSGFPVYQYYQKIEMHRINSKLLGKTQLRINRDGDKADPHRHRNGIAPNFIHSNDAAHLHLVTVSASRYNLSLAMIHDDYGTHAADADLLYGIIRTEFVNMYTVNDPLQDFADRYDLPKPPEKGNLDLNLVLDSPYFFS